MLDPLLTGESVASGNEMENGALALWRTAPAWRRLTIGACCLVVAAAAAPYVLKKPVVEGTAAAQDANAAPGSEPNRIGCGLRPGPLSPDGAGQVVNFLTEEQTTRTVARNEQYYHATANPTYASYRRLWVRRSDQPDAAPIVVALPPTQTAHAGDFVRWRGAFTEANMPCHFAPPVVTTVSGTAD